MVAASGEKGDGGRSKGRDQSCFLSLNRTQKRLALKKSCKRKNHSVWMVKSVLHNSTSSFNENGATEPARILLERLFTQTQKLEEQIGRELRIPQDVEPGWNLGNLESDLQAALTALNKKEEDLQEAESKLFLEYIELNHAKEDLGRREEEMASACSKLEKIEEELKQANLNLVSRATEIEGLKLQLKERDQQISVTQSALFFKEDEINKMMGELMKKRKEAADMESELKSKSQLLNEANNVVKRQELELQEFHKALREKEEELEDSLTIRKNEEEKLKVSEANLQKQTMSWLLAQEELKKLAEDASKHMGEANETLEDFKRVKKLLADVKSELVSFQKALLSSRQKMKNQEKLLDDQLVELEKDKRGVMSYMTTLKDAHVEVESERTKLRVAEARNKELDRDLSLKKELVKELQEQLNRERSDLQQAIEETSFLHEELKRRSTEFQESQGLLLVKESELVEARLEIQHSKSEQACLQLVLQEKDMEICNARKMLAAVNQEIAELRMSVVNKEDQLTQAMSELKEKDEHIQVIQHELHDTKLKFSEAETVVEKIVELTSKLVEPIKDKDYNALSPSGEMDHLFKKPAYNLKWQKKQVETELEITRETLRSKEMEVLAAQRALTIKDKELEMVLQKFGEREKEGRHMKEEVVQDGDDLRKLYALAQEKIGEKSIGDLAIEKLQLEAAQLEVQAATSALQKLTEMSRELLVKASLSIEADYDISIFPHSGSNSEVQTSVVHDECNGEVQTEIMRLSALTEQLVKEAGIAGELY
ncbi:hypothetical protein RJ640_014107 [Escallonia rubra]|uniref:Uncharacterized protein n=1 Tax=Escallonia rubra TaxID=112253 RepID=A0AA88RXQ4_9ASTE|nr:hypothetical protein RJ640_014107 [Escallonia rubra]